MLPPADPVTGYDRAAAVWACMCIYAVIVASISLIFASLYCAPCIEALGTAADRVGNGLAGGTLAGLIAISVYLGGQRSRSRSQKFMHARLLLVELETILATMTDSGFDRRVTRPGYERTGASRPHRRYSLERAVPASGHFALSAPWRVYEGLVSSGGMSHFGELMQRRLHTFYGHLQRGEYESAMRMARPLVTEVRRFRSDNAPPSRAATVRLLFAVLVLGGRLRLPRRRRPRRRSNGRHSDAGGSSPERPATILGPPGK